ncbi:acyl-CoA-binding domain-containing protein 4 isoform X2 [Malania oleifera]|uniref:acyl-CoA-binding domain-containing protein 4 isoform X2 n=1 Tax=Malania oleifera TaxID=397392 RepID=UPI0025AE03BD|nr:acyl-CoA-binding domain-containing protein 4 isoform X2 [Malania oleifera]
MVFYRKIFQLSQIIWGNKLLLVGGHSKEPSNNVKVWFIDLETHNCGVMETSGKIPIARGGHSVTLVGSKLIMFGGEDRSRRLLNDVHVLDLETMIWDLVETTQTPPAPRFDHTTAVHAERYLLIFGGCSHSIFFNDLHVLDLQMMEWSQPQLQGDLVSPRAGHAGVTIDGNWYIVGGGDNNHGTPETIVLNMSKLVWSVLTSVKERDPLSSEGLTVCSACIDGEKHLVAFGGYNGKYNNEVFVMRPKLRDSSRPRIFQSPAAAAAAASVTAAYALTKHAQLDFISKEDSAAAASVTAAYALTKHAQLDFISKEDSNVSGIENNSAQSRQDLSAEICLVNKENKELESAVAEARAENSVLKGKIDETNVTFSELSKELHSVQGQLVAERSRCSKLEAQIAEVQKLLESLPSIENEVQTLRSQKSALEKNLELAAVQRQSSGGVWRWISGGTSDP